MQHTLGVGIGERLADRLNDAENLFLGGPLAIEDAFQRFALDKFHHKIRLPVVICVVEYRHDIGMIELGNHTCLSLEAFEKLWILFEGWMQNLDRNITIQIRVVSLEHRSHAALPELLDDAVRPHVFALLKWHMESLGFDPRTLKLWGE